jgi:hypothetical protein
MNRIFTSLTVAATMTCATLAHTAPAQADPYCADLNVQDQLPKKYQKRGPFYSDTATGWIIGSDQLKNKYAVSDEAAALWHLIKAEFDNRGVNLVVMAAPPRPLFAPQTAIDAMGLPADVALSDLNAGFSDYITVLNGAGIVAPDLSVIAQGPSAADYYFGRDTHWTPMGAALSVAHLNAAMGNAPVQDSMARIETPKTYAEKGSLAGVVKAVCGSRPDVETVAAPQYAQAGSAASLLGDAPELDKIALVGTSFSDRYQRDTYQVADAIAFVMNADVDNFSATGGGLIGAMEAFIRSGDLANGNYKTVVWETPYSAPLTSVDGLRQILGALQATQKQDAVSTFEIKIGKDWIGVDHSISIADLRVMEITTTSTSTGQLVVELIDDKGGKSRVKMVKTDRIGADRRSNAWAISLSEMPQTQIVRVKFRMPKNTEQETVIVQFFK